MTQIIDKDHGFKRLTALVKEHVRLTIGIHKAEGTKSHGSITVAEVGAINEYGWPAKKIPSRSFVRHTHDAKLNENLELLAKLEGNVLEGKRTQEQAIKILGEVAAKQMVSRINDGIPPPNAPSTIAKKKSSKPLIDTGQLKDAITFRVKEQK